MSSYLSGKDKIFLGRGVKFCYDMLKILEKLKKF